MTITRKALVADSLPGPAGTPVASPAAPLLAGVLARLGLRPVRTPLADERYLSVTDPVALAVACTDEVAAVRAIEAWCRVAGPRQIVLAAPRSFCAGVERAVEIVEQALRTHGRPVYVRRQIVHNAHVVAGLEERGAVFVDELGAVPAGATVVLSAHGVAPAVREEAVDRGLTVVDATCPLVAKVHAEARRFAARGDTVVLIGHDGHDEVEGTLGQLPGRIRLVQSPAEAATIDLGTPQRVSYLTQTTLAADETGDIVTTLRERFPGLQGPPSSDICYATTNRQDAVTAVAARTDLVLVVGSANSSNAQRLVETAARAGTPARLIGDAGDLRPEWLAGARRIGLTAGASAPPHLVDGVVAALGGLGAVTVDEHRVREESVRFQLPSPTVQALKPPSASMTEAVT